MNFPAHRWQAGATALSWLLYDVRRTLCFEAVEGNIHQRLRALLDEHRARYRVMAHEAVGQCEAVSAIRGTALGQGAKALVCKVKKRRQPACAGDPRRRSAGPTSPAWPGISAAAKPRWPARRRWMPSPPAWFGAIPPFSFHPALRLVADPLLFERFPQTSPLTPGAWTGRSFSTPKTIYISPDQRSRPFAVLANRASAQISAAWRKNPCLFTPRCVE